MLDVVAAPERIGGESGAGLVGDYLLRPQRQRRRLFGRQGERLIVAVGVQRLGAAEHRGQRLNGDANDVVQRLLRLKRHPAGLRVKAQPAGGVVRVELLLHEARP